MPVDARTHQPYGLLHGGASELLAETLGSSAGNLCVADDAMCVGIAINANHLAGVREGTVTGTARPDRKSVVSGKSVSVRLDLGGRRIIKKKNKNNQKTPKQKTNKT